MKKFIDFIVKVVKAIKFFFKLNKRGTFEIYKDKRKQWRFRLLAPNNEIVAVSEGYKNKQNCAVGIKSIRTYAKNAHIKVK